MIQVSLNDYSKDLPDLISIWYLILDETQDETKEVVSSVETDKSELIEYVFF